MMLKLPFEKFYTQYSKEGKLHELYVLTGNDPFFLQESIILLRQVAKKKGFKEYYSFQINNSTDWKEIYSLCKSTSLFSMRQILHLFLTENSFNLSVNEKLTKIIGLLHKDLLLILQISRLRLREAEKNAIWFKKLIDCSVLVICQTPEKEDLFRWIINRAKQHQLNLDKDSCQLLYYCYEGNLFALDQVLNHLAIVFRNEKLTFYRIQQVVDDFSYFMPFHLIDALLLANSKRAIHILQQLRLADTDPLILCRILQRELLLLITLKRQSKNIPLFLLFKKYCIWKNRHNMIENALSRLKVHQLHQALKLLVLVQFSLYDHKKQSSVWYKLERLSFVLCHKAITNIFIND